MFGFPKTIRTTELKKNFLKSATFQINYPLNHQIIDNEGLLREKLDKRFPNRKEIIIGETRIQFTPKNTPVLESTKSATGGFEFRTQDNNKILAITKDALTYTIFGTAYTNFEYTAAEIQDELIPLLLELKILSFNRIAIRKINILEIDASSPIPSPQILSMIFNEPLIENFLFLPNANFIDSGVSNVTLSKDIYRLNLKYGILPQRDNKTLRQVVLDIDLFSLPNELQTNKVIEEFQTINDEIFNIFVWAIKDEIRSILKK